MAKKGQNKLYGVGTLPLIFMMKPAFGQRAFQKLAGLSHQYH